MLGFRKGSRTSLFEQTHGRELLIRPNTSLLYRRRRNLPASESNTIQRIALETRSSEFEAPLCMLRLRDLTSFEASLSKADGFEVTAAAPLLVQEVVRVLLELLSEG